MGFLSGPCLSKDGVEGWWILFSPKALMNSLTPLTCPLPFSPNAIVSATRPLPPQELLSPPSVTFCQNLDTSRETCDKTQALSSDRPFILLQSFRSYSREGLVSQLVSHSTIVQAFPPPENSLRGVSVCLTIFSFQCKRGELASRDSTTSYVF